MSKNVQKHQTPILTQNPKNPMNTYSFTAIQKAATILLAALCLSSFADPLFAARPTAARLLPEKTLAMVSVPNVQELARKFMNTNLGRITQDPQMKPFIETLYGSFGELIESAKDKIGLSLTEIVALPQGEITLALVATPDEDPAWMLIFEAGDQIANAKKLLNNALHNMKLNREETIGEVKCSIYDTGGDGIKNLLVFEKDNSIAICTQIEVAKQVLAIWNETKDARSLAENANYGAIANRCRGSKDEEPQFIWFADPVGILKSFSQTSAGAQIAVSRIAVAMLPALGLDGLAGVGGSVLLDTEQYNEMSHLHILLTSPRTGVFKAIAFEPGANKPERWVPADVVQYMTLNWNFPTSLKAIETLFDSFRGDGAFAQTLQNFGGRIDVDLQKQIVPALEGRVTYITRIQKPVTLESSQTLVALKLKDKDKDAENIQKILDGIAKKFPELISSQTSVGKSYYRINVPERRNLPEGMEPPPVPKPCFGIVEDYLVISNYPGIYEQVLATSADNSKSLGNDLEFKLVASKLERIAAGSKPAMLSFDRPEESFRYMYDLATTKGSLSLFQRQWGNNPFFKTVNSSLEKQPLPPFSVIQKYLAPGGSIVIDDETGIHIMGFTMKRKAE
jgi:hypothetical protein